MTSGPDGVLFSRDHLWVRITDGTARVGLTDFAQETLGDIVDISVPDVNYRVTAGQACGDIESTKSVNDLVAPVSGVVTAINTDLDEHPELVNTDPYGGRLNVDGDCQGDTGGHGGEQRAVMLYQVESYRYWERQLGLEPLEYGAFSENFTVTGMADDQVCIGDRYRVGEATRLAQETEQVLSIELHAEERGTLPAPLPGQYLTLQVVGASDPAPVRSYSICAVTDSGGYRIAVKREPGGLVSSWLHAHLRVGETLRAAAPRGVFTLDSRPGNPVVLISAGIGVTPVLAMLHALAATDSQRVVWWLHAARDGQHHPFAAEARELLARLPNAHTQVYFSRSGPSEDGVIAGPLDGAALGRLPLPVDATVYTCGPQAFMEQIASACRLLGITDVRRELFGSPDAINPGIVGESPVHHPQVPD
ncbi:MAG: MOSC domain-containing protein, partial [Trebonia sp.]